MYIYSNLGTFTNLSSTETSLSNYITIVPRATIYAWSNCDIFEMWRGICKELLRSPFPSCSGLGRTSPEKGTFHVSWCVARPVLYLSLSSMLWECTLFFVSPVLPECYYSSLSSLCPSPLSMCTCYSQCSVLDIIVCVTQWTEWCVTNSKLRMGIVLPIILLLY